MDLEMEKTKKTCIYKLPCREEEAQSCPNQSCLHRPCWDSVQRGLKSASTLHRLPTYFYVRYKHSKHISYKTNMIRIIITRSINIERLPRAPSSGFVPLGCWRSWPILREPYPKPVWRCSSATPWRRRESFRGRGQGDDGQPWLDGWLQLNFLLPQALVC